MEDKKMTKMESFEAIKEVLEGAEAADELVAFVDEQMAQLVKKAEKAKERAAKKQAEGDELMERVFGVLTDEYQNLAMLAEALEDEELTRMKITARLTKLVKAGRVEKEQMKLDGFSTASMCYRVTQDAE